SFFRIAVMICDEDIPACLIVNMDQTQCLYSAGNKLTYVRKGSKQVSVVGMDKKRAFTLVIGISLSGKVLPFQVVYAGSDRK
ncbi:hypothetical protein JAAARDRAFT_132442, partial [Jaapia argillacea MUCL 33604]